MLVEQPAECGLSWCFDVSSNGFENLAVHLLLLFGVNAAMAKFGQDLPVLGAAALFFQQQEMVLS